MTPFEFHADLFDVRTTVAEALADVGLLWLSDYGAIDLRHDVYGMEVTGIREKADARAIDPLLRGLLPGWRHGRTYYEDQNLGELGWKVILARNPEDAGDHWQPAG